MSSWNIVTGDQGSVSSEASEHLQNEETTESHDQHSDNESEDWILDELQRQIDDQLNADIGRQLEEQLWKEMDEHLERQMDEQIQIELNQQFDDLLATQNESLSANSRAPETTRDSLLQELSFKTPIEESPDVQNNEQEASAFTINAQIQKAVDQYEGLDLESTK